MYRILVVDDEIYIASSLAATIAESLDPEGFEIDAAFSADEALRKMERRRMDLVISDIRMPRMDGLALCRAVQKRWPECRFVFLTGHAEFDYARDALRSGCVDYILKTEGDERVIAAIHEAVRNLDAARVVREERIREDRALEGSRRALARDYLAAYLKGFAWDTDGAREQLSVMDAGDFLDGRVFIALLVADVGGSEARHSTTDSACARAAETLAPIAQSLDVPLGGGTAALLIRVAPGAEIDSAEVRGILEGVQDESLRAKAPSFSFVLDPELATFSQIPFRVKRLNEILASWPATHGTIIVTGQEGLYRGERTHAGEVVGTVDAFIQANLGGDVSLTRLAEIVSLNPAYLSRLYLQRTGTHLSEKIANERLKTATQLLCNRDMKISEVSAAIGFWTPSHFIRFFKQRTGSTPQAFRDAGAEPHGTPSTP